MNRKKNSPRELKELLKEFGGICPYRLDTEFNLYKHEAVNVNELLEKYCCIDIACVAWKGDQCTAFVSVVS